MRGQSFSVAFSQNSPDALTEMQDHAKILANQANRGAEIISNPGRGQAFAGRKGDPPKGCGMPEAAVAWAVGEDPPDCHGSWSAMCRV